MTHVIDTLAEPHNLRRLIVAFLALVVAAMILGAVALTMQVNQSRDVRDLAQRNRTAIAVALVAQRREREGRLIASTFTCAVADAVATAGRDVLLAGGKPQPEPFESNLLRLGFPSLKVRRAAAIAGAAAYVFQIRQRVAKQTGRSDLVRNDGSLDCRRLTAVAPRRGNEP